MQPLATPPGRKSWHVAYAGATLHVRVAVTRLCTRHSIFRFCGQTSSTHQLLREVSPTPDIVLMDEALLSRRGLTELAQLHCNLPTARTLLIGDSLQLSAVFAALRLGTWGVIARMRVNVDLDRALHAVASGELWLTRHQLAAVMAFTTSEPLTDFVELTGRENAVTHRVLLGESNKQIARALDIAEHTVKIHLHHAYGKLRVHNRMELLVLYHRGSDRSLQDPAAMEL